MKNVVLQLLKPEDYDRVAALIESDSTLRNEFGIRENAAPSGSKIKVDFQSWCATHEAKMFSITRGSEITGIMTLSRINLVQQSGRLGFWLGSHYRRQGLGSRAFKNMLGIARTMGLYQFSGSVEPSNQASIKLWEKFGASAQQSPEGNMEYRLVLEKELAPSLARKSKS